VLFAAPFKLDSNVHVLSLLLNILYFIVISPKPLTTKQQNPHSLSLLN